MCECVKFSEYEVKCEGGLVSVICGVCVCAHIINVDSDCAEIAEKEPCMLCTRPLGHQLLELS